VTSPVRLITADAPLADASFAVYAALIKAAKEDPTLTQNLLWRSFKTVAYERFTQAFEVSE
jgi:hypothetical protein